MENNSQIWTVRKHTHSLHVPFIFKMEVIHSRLGDELEQEGADNGAVNSFLCGIDEVVQSNVEFVNKADFMGLARMNLVGQLRRSTGVPLLDFQIQAIANIVYRPSLIKISKTHVRRGHKTHSLRESIRFGGSDVGVTVVNDLMPGSGKSLVTMVASIYFATHRAQEVVKREEILLREQRPTNWASRFGANDSERSYKNSIIVLASDKVVAQWEEATKQACEILRVSHISINRNPTKECLDNAENVSVQLFTSVANLRKVFPQDTGFVPCVIVDEYVVKATHNIATRHAEETPLYGRLVLVSADAGNTAHILLGSRRTSLIRATVANGEVDLSSLKHDVKLSAALMVCGVLSSQGRKDAHDFLISAFNKTPVEKYNLQYNAPVWGAMDGINHIMPGALEDLGIKSLAEVQTVEELFERIQDAIVEAPDQSDNEGVPEGLTVLNRLYDVVNKFLSEDNDCPVCLDKLKTSENQICMLCPCWHFVCKTCTILCLDSRDTCPTCRGAIDGIMETKAVDEREGTVNPRDMYNYDKFDKFDDFLKMHLPKTPSILEVCTAILKASADALLEEIENPILKLLIVGPSINFSNALHKALDGKHRELVKIVQLKVEGNKRKRTSMGYEQQLEWLKKNETEYVKVLCTHENVNFSGDLYGLT